MRTGPGSAALLFYSAVAGAQALIPATGPRGQVRLFPIDESLVSSREPRKDLPCAVTPLKPELGFDLRFHTGYSMNVPVRALEGHPNPLTMVFRVTPENATGQPVYFLQTVRFPPRFEPSGGEGSFEGRFDLGEGKYHVRWLFRDQLQKICSGSWDVSASLSAKDRGLTLAIPAGHSTPSPKDAFQGDLALAHVRRDAPLRVSVIANFAPQDPQSVTLDPVDLQGLIGTLRAISRDPSIRELSAVAVNIQSQQILYRQGAWGIDDLPALGAALKSLKLATVDLRVLAKKHGAAEFLVQLIHDEIQKDRPDALIVVSPRVLVDDRAPRELTRQIGEVGCPVFYMSYNNYNYNLDPSESPWRDLVGSVVKQLRGVKYTIRRPRDLVSAWSEVSSRLVHSKPPQHASAVGPRDRDRGIVAPAGASE